MCNDKKKLYTYPKLVVSCVYKELLMSQKVTLTLDTEAVTWLRTTTDHLLKGEDAILNLQKWRSYKTKR